MSSISMPAGRRKTTCANTSKSVTTPSSSPQAILIASWASKRAPTRSKPMARPKRSRNICGAMALARQPLSPLIKAMWCWLSLPSPLTRMNVSYYRSLYQRAVVALEFYPTHVTADVAFDAWYVYECAARHVGIGAVPLNQHGHEEVPRDHDGIPGAPRACACIPPTSSPIPMASVPNVFVAPYSFLSRLGSAVITSSLPRARAASRTLTGNRVD